MPSKAALAKRNIQFKPENWIKIQSVSKKFNWIEHTPKSTNQEVSYDLYSTNIFLYHEHTSRTFYANKFQLRM